MIRAIVHRSDFERLLASRPSSRSAHFAVHHVCGRPRESRGELEGPASSELSTASVEHLPTAVDNLPHQHWLGVVIPKRQARRAVTRNLLKRQVRSVFAQHEPRLPGGLWLVRLRQGFGKADFASAASQPMRVAVRRELEGLFAPAAPATQGSPRR
jgi:ribonuclease P protein component